MGPGWIRIAIMVLMLSFAAATAAEEGEDVRLGPYLGIASTSAIEQFDSGSSDVDNAFGLNARVGYRILPFLSAELQYEWAPEFDLDRPDFTDGELETHLLTANAKGIFENRDLGPFQPYLLAGVGVMFAQAEFSAPGLDEDDAGFAARLGLGLDIYLWDHVSMSIEGAYILTAGGVEGLDYVSVGGGLQYHF